LQEPSGITSGGTPGA
jgi:hypothetical protein